jgi:hypothetical protein
MMISRLHSKMNKLKNGFQHRRFSHLLFILDNCWFSCVFRKGAQLDTEISIRISSIRDKNEEEHVAVSVCSNCCRVTEPAK